jgi:anti-anti-sigma regulatory factor
MLWLIRAEKECAIASAVELKSLLLEWLASGTALQFDLQSTTEIDITVLQLLWAAQRAAARESARVVIRMSEATAAAALNAGFESFS